MHLFRGSRPAISTSHFFASLSLVVLAAACEPPPPVAPPAPKAAPAETTVAPPAAKVPQPEKPVSQPLPASTPQAEGIDEAALQKLVERARATESDALVVVRNGKQVGEWSFDKPRGPIEAMSVTKSVVSLLIGALVTDGKIKSLDQPVHEYYPEWRQGKKQQVTLRHLLNHTSGLQADRTTEEIYRSPDFVKLALAAELAADPGSKFHYNNKAVAILAGVIAVASGKPMNEYARARLFKPLGIEEFEWTLDKSGNPHAMAGLQILPADLAKLGQLVLDRGTWNGAQLIASSYVDEATRQSQPFASCGLLWWMIAGKVEKTMDDETFRAWKAGGVDPKLLDKLRPIANQVMDAAALREKVAKAAGTDGVPRLEQVLSAGGLSLGKTVSSEVVGFNANGWLGQWLIVLPGEKIVVVRMRRSPDDAAKNEDRSLGFGDITELVRALPKKP